MKELLGLHQICHTRPMHLTHDFWSFCTKFVILGTIFGYLIFFVKVCQMGVCNPPKFDNFQSFFRLPYVWADFILMSFTFVLVEGQL